MSRRTVTALSLVLLIGLMGFQQGRHEDPVIAYHLSWDKPNSHYFHIRMEIANPDGEAVDVRIPAWRPGRYIVQNYAKDIIDFEAADETGAALTFRKTDKGTWRIQTNGAETVVVRYKSYARALDAGASYLDETEAYLNPITALMYVPGQELRPVSLTLGKPDGWKVATPLNFNDEHGAYLASTYHELVDSPLIISPDFEVLSFDYQDARFEIVFQGQGNYDPAKIVEDLRKIVAEQVEIMQDVPFERYVFLYHLMPYPMGHGVEHKNSTSIVVGPAHFDYPGFYGAFLRVTSHEFFHVWNVERIRAEAIYHPDYSKENYTTMMWIHEGITSYYASLTLARAGLLDTDGYLQSMAQTFQNYDDDYARTVTSVAMTSWDSWTKTGQAPPYTSYSFYTAGHVLGFLLDLEVRGRTHNDKSLDDVFRYLNQTYARQNQGVPEDGFEKALETVTGSSFQTFFDAYVYGTEAIDYNRCLRHAGLALVKSDDPNRPEVRLGASIGGDDDMVFVQRVRPESAAFEAGLDIDDILLELDGQPITRQNLSGLLKAYHPGDTATLTFKRRGQQRQTTLHFKHRVNIRYEIQPIDTPSALQETIRKDWLQQ